MTDLKNHWLQMENFETFPTEKALKLFLFRDQSAKSFRSWALSNQIILSVCRFLSCHFWQIKLRQDNLRVKGVRHIWYVLTSWSLMLTIWTSWLRSSPWHNYFRSDPLLQFANGRQTVTTPGRNKTHNIHTMSVNWITCSPHYDHRRFTFILYG